MRQYVAAGFKLWNCVWSTHTHPVGGYTPCMFVCICPSFWHEMQNNIGLMPLAWK